MTGIANDAGTMRGERGEGAQPDMPDHVTQSVSELANLHSAHHDAASQAERFIRATTRNAGRPMFLLTFAVIVLGWVLFNIFAPRPGHAIDPPPFVFLELACTLTGVALTVLILVTQQRDDTLAERREQLTLELAVISDRKSAKIISLLEELRRDSPHLIDRNDDEAIQMAQPDDPTSVLRAIRISHGDTPADKPVSAT